MGIDIHNLNFLAYARDRGASFANTLAIGRQAVFVDPPELDWHARMRGVQPLADAAPPAGQPRYFEPMLEHWLGAKVADSVDASPYENARFIHDMNLPWPVDGDLADVRGRYDAVLDFGCLEHVFNFPVAWRNCVDVCRVGGHVLHALPANNLSGHGFYQFSPELFFNLYRPVHGFELIDVFFAIKTDTRHWWRVANPFELKRRVILCNSHEVYLMVLARKIGEVGAIAAPQQSDYEQGDWVQAPAALPSRPRGATLLQSLGLIDVARAWRERLRVIRTSGFELPAPDYQRVDVEALIGRRGQA